MVKKLKGSFLLSQDFNTVERERIVLGDFFKDQVKFLVHFWRSANVDLTYIILNISKMTFNILFAPPLFRFSSKAIFMPKVLESHLLAELIKGLKHLESYSIFSTVVRGT